MFIKLVGKEIKYQLKSITFYLFFAVVILFYITQVMQGVKDFKEPVPGQEMYGITQAASKEQEIEIIYSFLNRDFNRGSVLKYGSIINKEVQLSENQRSVLKQAIEQISPNGSSNQKLQIKVSYEEYLNIIRQVDNKLGGSTIYSDKWRNTVLNRPMTFEEAVSNYESILYKDKLTNAFGRNFADYMGITAGLFPIFLSAFLLTRDRRTKVHELIYSRSISSFKYVLSKYIGLCLVIVSCYFILAAYSTIIFSKMAASNNYLIDYYAFFKYTLTWIVPSVMFTVAMGMLISIIFGNGVVAIPVQFLLWMNSMLPLGGDYSFTKMIIRFNALGEYEKYMKWSSAIAANRIVYTIISVVVVLIATWLWSLKRGVGDGNFSKLFKSRKVQY